VSLWAWASDVLVISGYLKIIDTRLPLGDLTFGSELMAELIMCSLHLFSSFLKPAYLKESGFDQWSSERFLLDI